VFSLDWKFKKHTRQLFNNAALHEQVYNILDAFIQGLFGGINNPLGLFRRFVGLSYAGEKRDFSCMVPNGIGAFLSF
jgi:hypothetical protein